MNKVRMGLLVGSSNLGKKLYLLLLLMWSPLSYAATRFLMLMLRLWMWKGLCGSTEGKKNRDLSSETVFTDHLCCVGDLEHA